MKRKSFIGATALLLAIGSAVAVKANTHFAPLFYQSGGLCVQDNNSITCGQPGTGCTDPSIPGNPQLYQIKFSNTECQTPLRP